MTAKVVHLNGSFVAEADAKVSLFDAGYLLGVGVFATLRGDDGVCFRPEAHLAALADGAASFGLAAPDIPALVATADEVARRVGGIARVRVTVSETATSVIGERMAPPTASEHANGVTLATIGRRRAGEGTPKTTSYGPQVVARAEATRRGAAEGLQLSNDGSVAGGTMANLFVRSGRVLATPWLTSGCRAGVTRAAILELAPGLGLSVEERRILPEELLHADEVFLTSTRVECLPVSAIDARPIACGEATAALREALRALVARERAARTLGSPAFGGRLPR